MRKLIYLAFISCLVVACSHRDEGKIAAQAAKLYHEQLLKGDAAAFVDGQYRPDSIPQSYRLQLIDNMKMFVSQQQEEHRGIKEVRIANSRLSTDGTRCDVFLVFCYGDSTSEEVCIPMIKQKENWMMK